MGGESGEGNGFEKKAKQSKTRHANPSSRKDHDSFRIVMFQTHDKCKMQHERCLSHYKVKNNIITKLSRHEFLIHEENNFLLFCFEFTSTPR